MTTWRIYIIRPFWPPLGMLLLYDWQHFREGHYLFLLFRILVKRKILQTIRKDFDFLFASFIFFWYSTQRRIVNQGPLSGNEPWNASCYIRSSSGKNEWSIRGALSTFLSFPPPFLPSTSKSFWLEFFFLIDLGACYPKKIIKAGSLKFSSFSFLRVLLGHGRRVFMVSLLIIAK